MNHPPPSTSDPSRPDPPPQSNRKRRNKITAGAVLTGAASIATILTLFLTVGQQPQPQPQTPTGNGVNTRANAYPVNVETNFLNTCEANGALSVCQCSLSWFEQHVSMARFQQDEADLTQGFTPADIANVEQACGQ